MSVAVSINGKHFRRQGIRERSEATYVKDIVERSKGIMKKIRLFPGDMFLQEGGTKHSWKPCFQL